MDETTAPTPAAGPARPPLGASARFVRPLPWLLALLAVAALAAFVHQRTLAVQVDDARAAMSTRLELLASALNTELLRHEALPPVLALTPVLAEALQRPHEPDRIAAANDYLVATRERAGVEAVYLVDRGGTTIAASNHAGSDSFVGQNYGFRPYVADALAGNIGRFYAVGATTGRAGYFLAAPVHAGQRVAGVIAVKVALEPFERALAAGSGLTLVCDARGVVFLASAPRLRFRALGELTREERAAIDAERQYGAELLRPLVRGVDLRRTAALPRGAARGEDDALRELPRELRHELVRLAVGHLGWQLVALDDTRHAERVAQLAALAAVLAALALLAAWQALVQRRRRREQLRGADAEILRRIAEGTAHLQRQLAEQARTEAMLRATTDAAVQAGKLAVLGQMAAGISHELNQPLTAMRGFAANAIVLIDAGRLADVRANLQRIESLTERMGQVVGHLRAHARKQPAPVGPVDVRTAIDGAVQLLQPLHGHKAPPIGVHVEGSGLAVVAEAVRLEQVLVNLLRNGIEAGGGEHGVAVHAAADGPQVVIRVADRGPGIAPEAMAHLFEPFFTTKPAGRGLGLGLAVSRMIVEGFGGTLRADNRAGGGAEFVLRLPRHGAAASGEAGSEGHEAGSEVRDAGSEVRDAV